MPWGCSSLRQIFRQDVLQIHTVTHSLLVPQYRDRWCFQATGRRPHSCDVNAAVLLQHPPQSEQPALSATTQPSDRGSLRGPSKSTNPQRKTIPAKLAKIIDRAHIPSVKREVATSLFARIRQSHRLRAILTNSDSVRILAEQLAQGSSPQKVWRLLHFGHKLGARFKHSVYECVAFRLSETNHWHLLPALVALGKRHTGRTTVRLLNWRAKALVETQSYTAVRQVLGEFGREGLSPNRRTFHIVLRGHLRNHDVKEARACIQAMIQAGFPMDSSTHAAIVASYRGFGADDEVLSCAFEAVGAADGKTRTAILNSLMRLFLDKKDFSGASRVLQIFDQRHLKAVKSGSHDAASTIARNGSAADPMTQHHRMTVPDVATYTMLIDFLAPKRDADWVTSIFQRMKSAGLVPDSGVAAALIRAYSCHGYHAIALTVLEEICRPLRIHRKFFEALRNKPSGNKLVFGPFHGGPTVEVFNAVLRTTLSSQGVQATPPLLRLMRAADVEPNAGTLGIFMSYLEREENARPADIIRTLRQLTSYKVRPTLHHANNVIRSVLRRERAYVRGVGWNNMAEGLITRLRRHRLPEANCVRESAAFDPTAGIALPHSLEQRTGVRSILQSLASRGIKSDRKAIALRMKHEAVTRADIPNAERLFQQMIERGMHPTAHHYAALMEGYTELGNMRMAMETMNRSAANNVAPNVVMHTIMIVGYARLGRPDLAMRAFQKMLRSGVRPDSAAVDAVVSAFFAVKAFKLARQTLIELWTLVADFPEELRNAPLKTLTCHLRSMRASTRPLSSRRSGEQKRARQLMLRRVVRIWLTMTCATRKRCRNQLHATAAQ